MKLISKLLTYPQKHTKTLEELTIRSFQKCNFLNLKTEENFKTHTGIK